MASGAVMGAYGVSGLFWNNFVDLIINPDQTPVYEDTHLYPESVYKNLPETLRKLSYCYAGLILISVFLVFPGKSKTEEPIVILT